MLPVTPLRPGPKMTRQRALLKQGIRCPRPNPPGGRTSFCRSGPMRARSSSGARLGSTGGRVVGDAGCTRRAGKSKPIDGKPATSANGGTIGFSVGDPKLAEAWHKARVPNGGTSIEDRRACVPMGLTWLIFAIPMETNWSRLLVRLPDFSLELEENRPVGESRLLRGHSVEPAGPRAADPGLELHEHPNGDR